MKVLMLNCHSKSPLDNSYNLYDIYSVLLESQEYYPEIFKWYFKKFVPGISDGSRSILIYFINNKVAGTALLKNEAEEKKICSFWVKKTFRKNGIGKSFFGKCLEALDYDRPMITVPADRLCHFNTIFKYYDFKLEQVAKDYYRNNSREYIFNGNLDFKRNNYSETKVNDYTKFLWENEKLLVGAT